MLVDSKGKQINPSLNQFTDSVFRFSSPTEYEAMRDFLLGRALDWIKSNSSSFGVKELVGEKALGMGWEGTPLQGIHDHCYGCVDDSCQDEQKRFQKACEEAKKKVGLLLKDVLASTPCTLRFVQEKEYSDADSSSRNMYRLEAIPNVESDAE